MSAEAVTWALQQSIQRSSAKFLLTVLAHHVNAEAGDMLAWPSIASLCESTSQDRKTVISHLQKLIDEGFIEDTKIRKGSTGQIVVYRLKRTENGTVKTVPKTAPLDGETVPFFPSNSTVFPSKEYRFSVERVPKTGHGTGKEQEENRKGTGDDAESNASAPDVDLLGGAENFTSKRPALPCPYERIVDAYHELMPNNPRVKVLSEKRRRSIAARWKEAATLHCKPFGYHAVADGVAAWKRFFAVCADSPFLTGKAEPRPGRPPFLADIDFLVSPDGFAKCLENKYHREAA